MTWLRALGVAALVYVALNLLFPTAPRRTIVVVPILIQGDRIVPTDPETGASDAPSAQECCAKAPQWRI